MNLRELKQKPMAELIDLARDLAIEGGAGLRKQELVFALLQASAAKNEPVYGEGVLECLPDGFGFLRAPDCNYLPGPDDVYVPPSQIRRFNLRTGDSVSGPVRPPKEREAYFALVKVDKVDGAAPEIARDRALFDNLTPRSPQRKFNLEHGPKNVAMRIVDMLCPIGMGQRCLVVSPPLAGKTVMLQEIANAIADNHPETRRFVLLVDERPETVTEMQRAVKAEVIASTFDEPAARHAQVVEMVLEKAKRLVEAKQDVVIFVDSITRLARASNAISPPGGKILGAGLDSNALLRPKRFFGAARNVEEGGSLTIIATALVDTGSRMDDVILEELKSAANSEIHLDRKLMDKRIFPCIDIAKSATRKEDLLLPEWVRKRVWLLRKLLQPLNVIDAMEFLLDKVSLTETNQAFLESMNQ